MSDTYVLAIDQSTQGTKAILFDKDRQLVCRSDLPHRQLVNEQGWVSHDLDEIYRNTVQVVRDLVEKAGIRKEQIACLGISNQRETAAAWNRKTGEPLAHAVVWQCARATEICQRIGKTVSGQQGRDAEELIRLKTGIPLSPYFPAAKYAWLLENEEAVGQAAKQGQLCLGTIDSWLLFRLTGGAVFATDYSNASRTQLLNLRSLKWDPEICAWFGIDQDALPAICDSSHHFGETDFAGYLDKPIPICSLIGDSQGALFGQGCVARGMAKATYGTGSSVMMHAGTVPIFSYMGVVTSLGWGIGGKVTYVLEGNINYSGAVITWLKEDLGLIASPKETEPLASQANPADETYLVPAFSGLGAPYWEPEAKALLWGMSRTTGKKEFVKAAVESIAYQIADIVDIMRAENGDRLEQLFVDGGATENRYLMQFQSDLLRIPVNLHACEECSALGAALLAGLSYGIYQEEGLFSGEKKGQYLPRMEQERRDGLFAGWKKAVKMIKEAVN